MNWFSHILFVMLPIALLALATVVVAIYYKWKRGLELFIFFCAVLFVRDHMCHTHISHRMPLPISSGNSVVVRAWVHRGKSIL